MDTSSGAVLQRASSWAMVWAVLIILAGVVMLCLPFAAGLGIAVVVGWLLVIAGIFHVIDAFHAKGAGSIIWRLLVGAIYIIGGFDIAIHPAFGLVTLTLVLGIILIIQGVIGIIAFFNHRGLPGGGWLLVNAIIALAFGLFIWWDGARAAVWVIGTVVGVSLIFNGITRLMVLSAVRRLLPA